MEPNEPSSSAADANDTAANFGQGYLAGDDANYWRYEVAPSNVKVTLKNIGGVQMTGIWGGKYGEAFVAWAPLIKADKHKEELLRKHDWQYSWPELVGLGLATEQAQPAKRARPPLQVSPASPSLSAHMQALAYATQVEAHGDAPNYPPLPDLSVDLREYVRRWLQWFAKLPPEMREGLEKIVVRERTHRTRVTLVDPSEPMYSPANAAPLGGRRPTGMSPLHAAPYGTEQQAKDSSLGFDDADKRLSTPGDTEA